MTDQIEVETDRDLRPIASKFIRDEFQWDLMSEVKWDLVLKQLRAWDRILSNPTKFPKADFEVIESEHLELRTFLKLNGYDVGGLLCHGAS